MSIITDVHQSYIEIGGKKYDIYTNFKNWLKIDRIAKNLKHGSNSDIAEIIKLCYKSTLPPTVREAMDGILEFYSGTIGKNAYCPDNTHECRLFDFEIDADTIFCDFLRIYGINLCHSDMHWHVFLALFSGLDDNSALGRIMYIRGLDLSQIENEALRKKYRALKHRYSLKKSLDRKEKDADFSSALSSFF